VQHVGGDAGLQLDAAQVVLHSSQHSVAALIDRIAALERSAEQPVNADSEQLAQRVVALEQDGKSKQKFIQQLQDSNKALADQLEDQRCAMLYIADDVKACSADLQQLQAATGESNPGHELSEMWTQLRSVQQQGQEHETELTCVRDEIVDNVTDRLNRLQNTVAELQLPKSAIPSPSGRATAKEVEVLRQEVEECKGEVAALRDLLDQSGSWHTVSDNVEKMSAEIASMRTDIEVICQQLYSLKTSEIHEVVEERLADNISQVRSEMSNLSKDISAETQALGEQLSSAFNAITELEAGSFATSEHHHALSELRANMDSMQSSVQSVHVQLQEVVAAQSTQREGLVDRTEQSSIQQLDVEVAELHATVQQLAASSTLLREQLMEMSSTQRDNDNTDHADEMHKHVQRLGASVHKLQDEVASMQQLYAVHEQSIQDVSMRVDVLDSGLAHSGALAQAADSRSVLVDSALLELRCTVESLQQAAEDFSASSQTQGQAQDPQITSNLSDIRATLSVQAERVAALEQRNSCDELDSLKNHVKDTERSLEEVLGKVLHFSTAGIAVSCAIHADTRSCRSAHHCSKPIKLPHGLVAP
jgi:chromosome segregation ATPase